MTMMKALWRWSALALMGLVVLAHCGDDSPSGPGNNIQYEMTYLRDYQYLQRTYYHVGSFGDDTLGVHFEPDQDTIIEFSLFIPGAYGVPGDVFAVINIDPRDPGAYPKNVIGDWVHPLTEGEDYFLEPHKFWIRLTEPAPSDRFLACLMVVGTPAGRVEVGTMDPDPGTPRTLKMLRPEALYPGSPTWDYEWRNVYDLGVTGIARDDIKIDIRLGPRGTEGADTNSNQQDGIPFLEFFGLDRFDNAGRARPDGRVDFIETTIDPELGHLFFPNRRPFDPRPDTCYSPADPLAKLEVTFPELYATFHISFVEDLSVYYIEIGVAVAEE
jgi:hypothetical protein